MSDDLHDRGVPAVDYETALADALDEAAPMIRFWNLALDKFGEDEFEAVRDIFEDKIAAIAAEHGDRTDDLFAVENIEDAIWNAKLREPQA